MHHLLCHANIVYQFCVEYSFRGVFQLFLKLSYCPLLSWNNNNKKKHYSTLVLPIGPWPMTSSTSLTWYGSQSLASAVTCCTCRQVTEHWGSDCLTITWALYVTSSVGDPGEIAAVKWWRYSRWVTVFFYSSGQEGAVGEFLKQFKKTLINWTSLALHFTPCHKIRTV